MLSSGNVLFSAPAATAAALERRAEGAMKEVLGSRFLAVVRSVEALRSLLASDPYRGVRLEPGAKRVVTFLRRKPKRWPELPIARDGARILLVKGGEVFSAYVPGPRGPVFMTLIEKAFGREVTTRTWGTVERMAR